MCKILQVESFANECEWVRVSVSECVGVSRVSLHVCVSVCGVATLPMFRPCVSLAYLWNFYAPRLLCLSLSLPLSLPLPLSLSVSLPLTFEMCETFMMKRWLNDNSRNWIPCLDQGREQANETITITSWIPCLFVVKFEVLWRVKEMACDAYGVGNLIWQSYLF